MKFFDLFCGVGGFRIGMERNGHECIGSCEIDKYARQTYAKNFGHEPEFSDVTHINTNDIEDFDVLCGGFPCQAWSIAGYRKGFEDNRGDLFFQIIRIAREKQPTYLFLENVKGLLSHDKGASFREMLRTLDEVGYDIEWQIINSKYFVPQNRERVFIIGHFRGRSRGKILPLGFNTKDNPRSQGLKYYRNSKDDSFRIHNPDGIARTLRANSGGMGSKTGVYAVVKDHGKLRELKDDKSTMIGANYFKGADNHGERTLIAWSKSGRDWGVESRIKEGEANTLNCGDGCRNQSTQNFVLDDLRVRRLTPLECERLQGFPDNWTKGLSDTQRYKQIGNAVTVDVIEYIARGF
jgi:DNA (cytosine-5)-methyltransferase 1